MVQPLRAINDMTMWHRVGRGHGIDFVATDDEVFGVLSCNLPQQYSPYGLILTFVDHATRRWHHTRAPFEDFLECCTKGVHRFFIFSEVITQPFEIEERPFASAYCSLNGFLNLEHGVNLPSGFTSSLGIVDKVTNDGSQIVEHTEYRKIFELLRRKLRPFARRKPPFPPAKNEHPSR